MELQAPNVGIAGGGWRKKDGCPVAWGVCGRAGLSVSVSIHRDLEHEAQYSKTVERYITFNLLIREWKMCRMRPKELHQHQLSRSTQGAVYATVSRLAW